MDIKEFLKPDWRKIVLTILILIFLIYFESICSPIYYVKLIDTAQGSKRESYWKYPCGFLSENMPSLSSFYNSIGITSPFLYNPLYWILRLLISYIISLIIVWIYDKVKKK